MVWLKRKLTKFHRHQACNVQQDYCSISIVNPKETKEIRLGFVDIVKQITPAKQITLGLRTSIDMVNLFWFRFLNSLTTSLICECVLLKNKNKTTIEKKRYTPTHSENNLKRKLKLQINTNQIENVRTSQEFRNFCKISKTLTWHRRFYAVWSHFCDDELATRQKLNRALPGFFQYQWEIQAEHGNGRCLHSCSDWDWDWEWKWPFPLAVPATGKLQTGSAHQCHHTGKYARNPAAPEDSSMRNPNLMRCWFVFTPMFFLFAVNLI